MRHQSALLDLLGIARRSALPALERVVSDLDDLIETETAVGRTPLQLAEPASLHAAKRKVDDDAARLRSLEEKANALERRAEDEPRSGWRGLFGSRLDPERQAREARQKKLELRILAARRDFIASERALVLETQKYRTANAQHQTTLAARREQAERGIATAGAAHALVLKNPHFAWWGVNRLLRVAAEIQQARAVEHSDADLLDDWDLTPSHDIWGIPYSRRPKVF